jgi:hypothetical protein
MVEELLWRPSIPMDPMAFVGFLGCSPSIIGPGITRVNLTPASLNNGRPPCTHGIHSRTLRSYNSMYNVVDFGMYVHQCIHQLWFYTRNVNSANITLLSIVCVRPCGPREYTLNSVISTLIMSHTL